MRPACHAHISTEQAVHTEGCRVGLTPSRGAAIVCGVICQQGLYTATNGAISAIMLLVSLAQKHVSINVAEAGPAPQLEPAPCIKHIQHCTLLISLSSQLLGTTYTCTYCCNVCQDCLQWGEQLLANQHDRCFNQQACSCGRCKYTNLYRDIRVRCICGRRR